MGEDINNIIYKDGFAGDSRYFIGFFLGKINFIFMLYLDRYNNDETRFIYMISRLNVNDMNWATTSNRKLRSLSNNISVNTKIIINFGPNLTFK